MNKTNMNYIAPEMEVISIETQNCFASGPLHSPSVSFGISSGDGLDDLGVESTDWN